MVRYSARERHGLARKNGSKGQVSTRFPCVSIEGSPKIRVGRAVRGRGAGVGEGMQSWAAYERVRAGWGRGKEGPGRRFSPLRVEARSRARGYGKKVNAPQPRTHSRPTQRASLCERRCAGRRAASGRRASTIRSHARSLLSRSMQRAHVCNPVSTSRVLSTLPIGSLKFRRPPRSSLPSISRTGLLFADTNDTIFLFSFLSFSPIDAAGRSRIFPSRESGARVEEWVAAEVRVCALFPPAGKRGRARELRVRPRSGVVATLLPFPRTKGSLTRWRAYAWPADPDVTRGHVNRG